MNTTDVPAQISQHWSILKPLLPTYAHLIISSIFPIFIAAHASLRRPISASTPRKTKPSDADDDEETSRPLEALSTSDAFLFPILAGLTLTGLYLLIKWLEDPSLLNKLLGYYFNWVGAFFAYKFAHDILFQLRSVLFPLQFSHATRLWTYDPNTDEYSLTDSGATKTQAEADVNALFGSTSPRPLLSKIRRFLYYRLTVTTAIRKPLSPSKIKTQLTVLDFIAATLALGLALITTFRGTPWYITNFQGFAFCYGSLQYMTPGTAGVGSLLLSLLFFYDIYMVFFTPMMVTVATKLEVPIKLLFPRPDDGSCVPPVSEYEEVRGYLTCMTNKLGECLPPDLPGVEAVDAFVKCLAKKRTMAMLGLGDIVVPGIMIAFALRFDLYRYYLKMGRERKLVGDKQQDKGAHGQGNDERLDVDKVMVDKSEHQSKTEKPQYIDARGLWAERWYTARTLWTDTMKAKQFPKTYFWATVVGYLAGMIATVLVMQIWQHAQPALLYLVPGVLGAFWTTALVRGELKLLWNFDEAEEDKEKEKESERKSQKKTEVKEGEKKNEKHDEGQNGTEGKATETSREATSNGGSVISLDVFLPAYTSKTASKSEDTT